MKKLLSALCLVYCAVFTVCAQETESTSPFLFDEYKEAIVFMKDMSRVRGKLNLYRPTGEFHFIDEQDKNQIKILSQPEKITMIRFGNRIFLPLEKGAVEVLSSNPLLHVQYKASIQDKGKTVGYGGTSSLVNVKSYSSNRSGTGVVSDPLQLVVGNLYNVYYIGKKQKEISSMKQLLKYYSKHKETLEKYIKEKDIEFNNALQIMQLVQYAHSLEQ